MHTAQRCVMQGVFDDRTESLPMSRVVHVLNGPNLNLLGTREPQVYGAQTLSDVERLCEAACTRHGFSMVFRQSNHEGVLVDWIHEAGRMHAAGELAGVVLNAGAYTHTSVALMDALLAVSLPVIEVHLSDPSRREEFRHRSYVAMAAKGSVVGLGFTGYRRAMELLMALAE